MAEFSDNEDDYHENDANDSNDDDIDYEDIFTDTEDEENDDDDQKYESFSPKPSHKSSSHNNKNNANKHKWQWHTGSHWKDYNIIDSQTIESQYGSANVTHITFKNIKYQIDLINLQQINPQTGTKHQIRRIPLNYKGGGNNKNASKSMFKNNGNNNNRITKTNKWQWHDGNNFVDYYSKISIAIEKSYINNKKQYKYTNPKNKQSYTIKFDELKQFNDRSFKSRDIRRVPITHKIVKQMKWQWFDGKHFVDYSKKYSLCIENAYKNGDGEKEYKFKNNKSSYTIKFKAMKQRNDKTKKCRDIRRVRMDVKGSKPRRYKRQRTKDGWPNPKYWKGPKPTKHRKVFGSKKMKLYHITDANSATLIFKEHKMIRGGDGMFGGGIYFAETINAAKHKAHKKGVLVTALVFTGKEHIVQNHLCGKFTFQDLQKMGCDSVNAPNGAGNGEAERVVYNFDQVCVIKQESCV